MRFSCVFLFALFLCAPLTICLDDYQLLLLPFPLTSLPAASKIGAIYLYLEIRTMCQSQYILYVYTHTLYLVSDLEVSDNGDPLYGIIYCR
jgi:uncharacterized membrane protein